MQVLPSGYLGRLLLEVAAEGTEGTAFKEGQRMRWLDDTISSMYVSLSQLWEIVTDRKAWQAAVRGVGRSRTLLSD